MTIIIGTVVDWQKSPRLFWIPASIDNVTAQDYLNTARQEHEHDLMNLGEVDHLVDATGKEELGGGTKVGITITNRNVQIAFAPETTVKESGTVTTPDTTGITLIDDAALFQTNGVLPGALLINLTDISLATVISIELETRLICSPLGGGSDNQWDSGDSYVIWNTIQKTVLGGNVVAVDDVGAEMSPIFPTPLTQVIVARASTGTLQELEAIQYSSFDGAAHIDVINGRAGTGYPLGTPEYPSNNITDTKTIAVANGFDRIHVMGNITLASGDDVSGYTLKGQNPGATIITCDPGCITYGTGFQSCTLNGTLNGPGFIDQCYVTTLLNCEMSLRDCLLLGDMTLAGSGVIHLIGCSSAVPGTGTPSVDMGGSGRGLGVRHYSGGIEIKNLIGAESVSLDFSSGHAKLHSTVTAGTFVIRGAAKITDNSTGTSITSTTLDDVPDLVWDELLATHQEDGTTGRALSLAAAGGDMQNPGAGSVTVYGTITNNQTGIIVDEVGVKAIDPVTDEILVWNKTNADGYFELFLDPAEYIFEFTKAGYLESETQLTVPDQATFEIPAITFIPETIGAGTGSETVTEVLVDSNMDPIEGARCRAFIDGDMDTIIAQVMTDASGRFTLYLDPETYIIECRYGDSLRYLRVIVELGSTDFTFEDITTDYIPPPPFSPDLGRGIGTEHVSDYVQDTETNRLRYIHVIVKVLGTDEWIAEDYTNENGEFHLYLDVGSYNFFFSGPDFTDITARGDVTSPDILAWT